DETKHLGLGASLVSGTVRGPDGAPVPDARVEARPLGEGWQQVVTDPQGRFKLPLPNDDTGRTITEEARGAAAPGAEPGGFSLYGHLHMNGSAEQEISIPGREVTVRAFDAAGQALAGVGVASQPLSYGSGPLSQIQAPDYHAEQIVTKSAGS